ncbi:ApeI family dehydratase [Nocardia sp. R16R-3T]
MRTVANLVTPFDWHFTELSPAVLTTTVDAGSAVFDGHFPGRPVVPGVCLIDMAHRAVRGSAMAESELVGVESAKFADAVLPGDQLTVRLSGGGATVTVVVSTARGESCRMVLRYEAS